MDSILVGFEVTGSSRTVYTQRGFFRGSEGWEIFFENVEFWEAWEDTAESFITVHWCTNARLNSSEIF